MEQPKTRKDRIKSGLRRAVWLFMALLFVVTAVGVGIYYFWQATHQNNQSQNGLNCRVDPNVHLTQPPSNGQLKGTKIADFKPGSKINYLSCTDIKVGSGATVNSSDTVTVIYTGALSSSGVIFESSFDSGQPLTISLSNVIPGWSLGMVGMKESGTRRLLIPSQFGYGPQGAPPTIPPNSDLVFDITLLKINKQ